MTKATTMIAHAVCDLRPAVIEEGRPPRNPLTRAMKRLRRRWTTDRALHIVANIFDDDGRRPGMDGARTDVTIRLDRPRLANGDLRIRLEEPGRPPLEVLETRTGYVVRGYSPNPDHVSPAMDMAKLRETFAHGSWLLAK